MMSPWLASFTAGLESIWRPATYGGRLGRREQESGSQRRPAASGALRPTGELAPWMVLPHSWRPICLIRNIRRTKQPPLCSDGSPGSGPGRFCTPLTGLRTILPRPQKGKTNSEYRAKVPGDPAAPGFVAGACNRSSRNYRTRIPSYTFAHFEAREPVPKKIAKCKNWRLKELVMPDLDRLNTGETGRERPGNLRGAGCPGGRSGKSAGQPGRRWLPADT